MKAYTCELHGIKPDTDPTASLLCAVTHLDVEGTKFCLQREGVQINKCQALWCVEREGKDIPIDCETALHLACKFWEDDAIEIIRLLLDHKADPNVLDKYEEVEDNDFGERPLHHAATGNSPAIIKMLLEAKADIEATTIGLGETALMIACGYGYPSVVEVLLSHNADTTSENENGETALEVEVQDEKRQAEHDKCKELIRAHIAKLTQ